jgi:hypothetical protein
MNDSSLLEIKDKLLIKINKLPDELVEYIKDFIPFSTLIWLNKKIYIKHHKIVKGLIMKSEYENYIRDTIRRDNYFVFKYLFKENFQKWLYMKKYMYKNIIYSNYVMFLSGFCIDNQSDNCRKIILDKLDETGLSKNQHKKNTITNIRWKH